jgi:8-amino-7-oxononanoate synthase
MTRRPLTPTLSPIERADGGEGVKARRPKRTRGRARSSERTALQEARNENNGAGGNVKNTASAPGTVGDAKNRPSARDTEGEAKHTPPARTNGNAKNTPSARGADGNEKNTPSARGTESDAENLPSSTDAAMLHPPADARKVTGTKRSRPDLIERLAAAQAERAHASLLRRLRNVEAVDGARIVVDGRALLNFASNDYLGLAGHPALSDALARGAAQWGTGATAAHLLGGHREEHAALEDKLARWTGRERALLFSTGFMANLGAMQALLGDGDSRTSRGQALCVQDKLNHASLLDAAKLGGAELKRYQHGDIDSARRQLETRPGAAALLATDGVFSMDGDVAPLAALAALCREQQATLMVDDAHGLGVLGIDGAGSLAESRLTPADAPVLMATLGKALGVAGAFVAGSAALIDGLIQFARPYIYTTAMPPALAAAASAAVDIARFENWRRDKLARLIAHFRAGAAERGIELMASRTPIQPVVVGASAAAVLAAQALDAEGFFVPAIRPPTVPQGKARLRVTLSARHEEADVERLLNALARAIGAARTQR